MFTIGESYATIRGNEFYYLQPYVVSKLLQRLDQIARESPRPLGFGASAAREAVPAMLLLALCKHSDPVTEKTASGADALVFTDLPTSRSVNNLKKLGTPWGVSLERYTSKSLGSLRDAGCDFLVVPNLKVKLDMLHGDEIGRFFQIPPDFSTDQARSIVDLPVDMVLLPGPLLPPLTLQQLLDLSTTRGEVGKPALVVVNDLPSEWEIECLRDIGVDGLILDIGTAKADALESLKQRILHLPRRRSRAERTPPSVPSTDQVHASELEEDEYDEI